MNALSPAQALTASRSSSSSSARPASRSACGRHRPRRLPWPRVLHVPGEPHLAGLLGLDARRAAPEPLDRLRHGPTVRGRGCRRPRRLSSERAAAHAPDPSSREQTRPRGHDRAPLRRRGGGPRQVAAGAPRPLTNDARRGRRAARPGPLDGWVRPTSWAWAPRGQAPPGGTRSSTPIRMWPAHQACPRRSTSSTGSGRASAATRRSRRTTPTSPGRRASLAGEWTPGYMLDPWTPPLLRRAAPDARLLVLLRDPVERFRSGRTLAENRLTVGASARAAANAGFQRGIYADQLLRLWRAFPREQVLVLQFERCVREPDGGAPADLRVPGPGPGRGGRHRRLARGQRIARSQGGPVRGAAGHARAPLCAGEPPPGRAAARRPGPLAVGDRRDEPRGAPPAARWSGLPARGTGSAAPGPPGRPGATRVSRRTGASAPPDFVGVGAQKAGTSWWNALIEAHPDVHRQGGQPKELHFFDGLWEQPWSAADATRYARYFPRPTGAIAGEWTPGYMIDFWTPGPDRPRGARQPASWCCCATRSTGSAAGSPTRMTRPPIRSPTGMRRAPSRAGCMPSSCDGSTTRSRPSRCCCSSTRRAGRIRRAELARTSRSWGSRRRSCRQPRSRARSTPRRLARWSSRPASRRRSRMATRIDLEQLRDLAPELDLARWPTARAAGLA